MRDETKPIWMQWKYLTWDEKTFAIIYIAALIYAIADVIYMLGRML